ncbi:MAG: MipA/OmpV family protein [Ramlibacter sp.]|uniref:MipA/OmpV family protein n=1 Tax=Ramlibacter sp. TaxID=1917967 RepID=UPI00262D58A7|nr:MipA/OmpV family protein [Ramlibacter sp.]MDH4376317.1 MipA/OmpV family protein [Ramlibacter sp.]
MQKVIATITFASALTGAGLAHAQSDFYRRVLPPNVAQGGTVAIALVSGREYAGSDESRTRLLPGIEYQWSNGFFAGAMNGLGYNASTRRDMAYGLRLTADFGRSENRSPALQGLGDIEPRPTVGAFLNVSPGRGVRLNSSFRYGSGNDRQGLVVDVGAGWGIPLSPQLLLGTSISTSWANAAHQQTYFGVDAAQASRSALASYTPGAGAKDVRVGASLVYLLTQEWSVLGSVSYTELLGSARVSPIVRQKASTSGTLGLAYRF